MLFVDIMMGDLDGFDFVAAYKKIGIPKSIKIYMLSSSVNPSYHERVAGDPYISELIQKNLTREKLLDILELNNK